MGELNKKKENIYSMTSKEVYFGVDVHERESQVAVLGKDGIIGEEAANGKTT
ncbi:MAG: hypothetical protein ACP5TZ_06280 [Nitrososphaeria archaeon]